ncbi:MAG TPA: T9SS type A sorting domain-containing protein [Chitinophagales bacterium]|nr:T9SS type A sorting domain-containing protein [Chitinophagales bacterium]
MKKIIIACMAYLLTLNATAQNLVPNPSFEDTIMCPNGLGQVYNTVAWSSVRLSPDYFNSCSNSGNFTSASVPHNYWGYQPAASGNAYGGFAGEYGQGDIREYLAAPLLSNLAIGIKYFISLKVSLSYRYNGLLCAINNLGVLFTTGSFTENTPLPVLNYAHLHTTDIVSDTTSWTIIRGYFIADSNYAFINIGNFYPDSSTNRIQFLGNQCNSYYYVDDVCVSTDSVYCSDYVYMSISNYGAQMNANVYPNPFTDHITIQYKGLNIEDIKIFNSSGQLVFSGSAEVYGQSRINIGYLTGGLYFVCCYNKGEAVYKEIICKL